VTTLSDEHLQTLVVRGNTRSVGSGPEWGGSNSPKALAFIAIAVGLLLALGLWQVADRWNQELVQGPAVGQPSVPVDGSMLVDEPSILTKIEPASDDCEWYVEHELRTEAESYRSGDIIRVTSGKLSLRYTNGIEVVLHPSSAYQLISEMNARILLGRLTATVSEAGIGFSVITPRATVIDLGTEFGIEVNHNGATDVVVFKGEVDVDYHDDQANRTSAQRLRMGEAVHLDAKGTASRIVSINNSTYSSGSLPESSRPVVIAEVRDNIERTSSLSYYEIVHGGLREDVFPYVDRPHRYIGIAKAGLPPYLVGGDYVKTFNDDKIREDIRVSVQLAVPARLYVLFDDRLATPKWLRDKFRDTGDNIGVELSVWFHEGWYDRKPLRNVKPGESVDGIVLDKKAPVVDSLSVWVRDISEAGVVALGATEDRKIFSTMYGIVAVPLELHFRGFFNLSPNWY